MVIEFTVRPRLEQIVRVYGDEYDQATEDLTQHGKCSQNEERFLSEAFEACSDQTSDAHEHRLRENPGNDRQNRAQRAVQKRRTRAHDAQD